MDPVAVPALEPVTVEQGHEQLEIRLLAVMRGGGHEQEMAGEGGEQLAQAEALGVLGLAAEDGGRHLVRFVADHQVPAAIRRLQFLLQVLVAGQLVQPGDDQVLLHEPVAGAGGFEFVVGDDLEGQREPPVQFVLPLLRQATRTDDQTPLQVAAGDQFLDEQACHDGLAGARVVRQQEAERLPGQHGLIDRGDLVRQGIDQGGVDRQQRVEQVGQADAVGLGDQAELGAVTVEAPGAALLDQVQPGFVTAVEQFVGHLAAGRLVGQFKSLRAKPLDADNGHQAVRQESADGGVRFEIFEDYHRLSLCWLATVCHGRWDK